MKNLVVIILVLTAIAAGTWIFYPVPQQKKEDSEITVHIEADENVKAVAAALPKPVKIDNSTQRTEIAKTYNQKQDELKKLKDEAEDEAETKTEAETEAAVLHEPKPVKIDNSAQIAELTKTCNQKQNELKKLKDEANKYTIALKNWDQKSPDEVDTLKEYQNKASKIKVEMIEDAKTVESKKQELTLAQRAERKAGSQLRAGRSVKEAIGWRYMKEPKGVCHPMSSFPQNSHKGPTMLVYEKDTRNENNAAVNHMNTDDIKQEFNCLNVDYNKHKADIAKIKDDYKSALESKLAEFKPQVDKLSQEISELQKAIDAKSAVSLN